MADNDTATTRLVLIRHGESNVTVNRVIGGHRSCSGLSELGRRQADRLRERLAATGELSPDVLIASNYPRAIETAEAIAPAFDGIPMAIDEGFGEHDPGPEIDGMTFDSYVDRFGTPDWTNPDVEIFPGGETISAFHTQGRRLRCRAPSRPIQVPPWSFRVTAASSMPRFAGCFERRSPVGSSCTP